MTNEILISKTSGSASVLTAGASVLFAMTDAVSISIITSISAVVMAALSAYFSYRSKVTAGETHQIVNSRMNEFMEMAKKSFRAEGVLQEKKEAAVRASDATASRAEGAAQEAAKSQP